MPTYNTARYVQDSIERILEPDYPQMQLIMIDNTLTDMPSKEIHDFQTENIVHAQMGAVREPPLQIQTYQAVIQRIVYHHCGWLQRA